MVDFGLVTIPTEYSLQPVELRCGQKPMALNRCGSVNSRISRPYPDVNQEQARDLKKSTKEEQHGKCSAVDDGHHSRVDQAL